MRPRYTVTPTGPHTLKISGLLQSKNLKSVPSQVESRLSDTNNTGLVMKTSVSVQTPIFLDTTQSSAFGGNSSSASDESHILKARDCCLDVAATALSRSEELATISDTALEGLLPDSSQKWDANSSEDLISIIASGDLFSDGHFGRGSSTESPLNSIGSCSLNANPYNISSEASGSGSVLPTLMLTEVESEEEAERILDERTGEFVIYKYNDSEDEMQPLSHINPDQNVEMILDEATGEFIPADSKKLSSEFNIKCKVNAVCGNEASNRITTEEPEWLQDQRKTLQEDKRSDSSHNDGKDGSRVNRKYHNVQLPVHMKTDANNEYKEKKVTFSTVVERNGTETEALRYTGSKRTHGDHLKKPRPANTSTSFTCDTGRSTALNEQDHRPVDMRKCVLGLQVDGNDDSHESQASTNGSKCAKNSTTANSKENTDDQSSQSNSQPGYQLNQEGDQTLSQYSEIYGDQSTQNTPTEPSSLPSLMAVSPNSSASTVEGYENYYEDHRYEPEYQPEVYDDITTSSPSEVVEPLDNLQLSPDNNQPMQVPKTLEKQCREAIASCDELLRSFEGSHHDMSTVSAGTTGSMNTTTDYGIPEGPSELEMMTGFTTSTSSVTLEVADNDYEDFRKGIKKTSSPDHNWFTDAPTQVCSDEQQRIDNHPSTADAPTQLCLDQRQRIDNQPSTAYPQDKSKKQWDKSSEVKTSTISRQSAAVEKSRKERVNQKARDEYSMQKAPSEIAGPKTDVDSPQRSSTHRQETNKESPVETSQQQQSRLPRQAPELRGSTEAVWNEVPRNSQKSHHATTVKQELKDKRRLSSNSASLFSDKSSVASANSTEGASGSVVSNGSENNNSTDNIYFLLLYNNPFYCYFNHTFACK